ncbi:MAG TPA: hypothetical protein VGM90_13405 [Kofleriaceae bacterium]
MRRALFLAVLASCSKPSAPPPSSTPPASTRPTPTVVAPVDAAPVAIAVDAAPEKPFKPVKAYVVLRSWEQSAGPPGNIKNIGHNLADNLHYEVGRCYDDRLETAPALKATFRLSIEVDANGAVATATATGVDDEFSACATKWVRGQTMGTWDDAFKPAKLTGAYSFTWDLGGDPVNDRTGELATGRKQKQIRDGDMVAMMRINRADTAKLADLLSGDGSDREGDMSVRRPGADLGSQVTTQRPSVAIGGYRTGDARTGTLGSGRGPSGPAPAPVPEPASVSVRLVNATATDAPPAYAEVVNARISSAYMTGLKRCYRTALTTDARAKGALLIRFTVNEVGRATNASATGIAPSVGACASALLAGWTFSIPRDADGEATEVPVAITYEFLPG